MPQNSNGKNPPNLEKKAVVQIGRVPPYSLVENVKKASVYLGRVSGPVQSGSCVPSVATPTLMVVLSARMT